MLVLRADFRGVEQARVGVQGAVDDFPGGVRKGLSRIVREMHREATGLLSGPGRTPMRLTNRGAVIGHGADAHGKGGRVIKQKSALRRQADSLEARPGSTPVPVITGNLRRLLDFVEPGRSKSTGFGAVTAGNNEAVLFDSAAYAEAIHEGKFSSAKYGPRRFLIEALQRVNQGAGMVRAMEDEITHIFSRRGV